jgi:hypothetical protein
MTHLSRELIRAEIEVAPFTLTSPIPVDDDAIDSLIELVNTFYEPFIDTPNPVPFITAYISGEYEKEALKIFNDIQDRQSVGEYLCQLILTIASSETVLAGKKIVGIRQILHAIYTNCGLKETFRRLEALVGGPTLPPPCVYEKLIGDPQHFDQQSIIDNIVQSTMIGVDSDVEMCTGFVIEYIDAVIDDDMLIYLIDNVKEIGDRPSLWSYIIKIIYDQMIDNQATDIGLTFKNYLNAVINNTYWDLTYFLLLPVPRNN